MLFSLFIVYLCSLTCIAEEVKDRWLPWYHLHPPYGWMNDPNGFCYFKGEIHLFYQFNPKSSLEPGIAHWGHAKSKDFFNWEHLDIAMYPNETYDKDGVFSGSALIEDDKMYIFYTGQQKYNNGDDHYNRQALATSTDGKVFTKYDGNPIIFGEDYQPNFRDPKVWKNNGKYYMVLGNSYQNPSKGRVVLFTSQNKKSWSFASVIDESDGSLGYMWECPDLFELDGKWVLLFSPQGVEPEGDKYKNLYQCGYKIGTFDYENNKFTPESDFQEADHGTDFYATQTFYDEKTERRILVAWLDMWERNYPEGPDGFTGQMTLPRTLSFSDDGKLRQWPVEEIEVAKDKVLRSGEATSNDSLTLENNAAEIKIEAPGSKDFVLILEAEDTPKVTISYSYLNETITVDRGGNDGLRRTKWNPKDILELLLYLDKSSYELFCGNGEVTFSCRYFPKGKVTVRLDKDSRADKMTVTSMKRTVFQPKSNKKNKKKSGLGSILNL